jgi:hypothetical protein
MSDQPLLQALRELAIEKAARKELEVCANATKDTATTTNTTTVSTT